MKFTDTATVVDWGLVERARYLAGLKGFVTNIPEAVMAGEQAVAAYHDLYQVERSFRMSKSDLAARPMLCRRRHSIGYAEVSVMPMLVTFVLVRALRAGEMSA